MFPAVLPAVSVQLTFLFALTIHRVAKLIEEASNLRWIDFPTGLLG
jgi:hypothetical protein